MMWKSGKTGFHGMEVFAKVASMAWKFVGGKEKRRLPKRGRCAGGAGECEGAVQGTAVLWGRAVRETSQVLEEAMKGVAVPKGVGVNMDALSVM